LKRHVGVLAFSTFAAHHAKLFAAALLAMAPLFALMYFLEWESADSSALLRAIRLCVILAASGLLYLLLAKLFKISEIATLAEFGRGLLKKRKNDS
jgi:putative peptidoglycan lipid II flippase